MEIEIISFEGATVEKGNFAWAKPVQELNVVSDESEAEAIQQTQSSGPHLEPEIHL